MSKIPSVFIAGASRGLGYGIAKEFVKRGWNVVGTVRDLKKDTPLSELALAHPERLVIEELDINDGPQIAALSNRLRQKNSVFDITFVNAGVIAHVETPIGKVPKQDFIDIMVTNAYSPLQVIEAFTDLTKREGLIGAMTSLNASIGDNASGFNEIYRASKAALNMMVKSVSVRKANQDRAYLVLSPGWVQTDMGGPNARWSLAETAPKLVDILIAKQGKPGLEFLNHDGSTCEW